MLALKIDNNADNNNDDMNNTENDDDKGNEVYGAGRNKGNGMRYTGFMILVAIIEIRATRYMEQNRNNMANRVK